MRTVLILGATSALARAVATEFAAHGFGLILAGRDCEELEAQSADLALRYGVKTSIEKVDVLDFEPQQASLSACLSYSGEEIEGAVVCIGYLGHQELAQADWREAKRVLDTNFTGCALALEYLARHFEERGSGFICGVSSVAGDRVRQSNYLYGSAKAGLSAYLQGLRNRLYRSGVRVITVKPGFVDTRMTYGRTGLFLLAAPRSIARGIYRSVVQGKDVVYLPWFWRWIMLVLRLIPESVFKRLKL